MSNPYLIAVISFFGVLFLIVLSIVLTSFASKKNTKWSYLFDGIVLILFAISALVGIELIEGIYSVPGYIDSLKPQDKDQLNHFIQTIITLKWAFTLVSGGIGVNLVADSIINRSPVITEESREALEKIDKGVQLSHRLLELVIALLVINLIILAIK